jgi:sortase A
MRVIAIIFFLIGLSVTSYHSYQLYAQKNIVTPINKQNLNTSLINNPTQETKPKSSPSYKQGDLVAELIIPSIQSTYPVLLGSDNEILKKGIGMYQSKWTTLPSQKGHTVLSGHRDTVFTRLGEIKIGDYLIVKFDNRLFSYKVKNIWVTSKKDRSVIVSKDEPTLTLTTCYPFHYIGSAPKRYIVQGTLEEKEITSNELFK